MNIIIRIAVEADLLEIVRVYNESIPGGWSTADTKPIAVQDRIEWFRRFDPVRRPIWVVEVQGEVAGWASLSSFYAGRPAYDATAEISMYIDPAFQKQGLGKKLKQFVINQCPSIGITTLLSMHFDHNEATRKLNEQLGFVQAGHLPEIAVVCGEKRGLVIAMLRITPMDENG